MLRYILHYFHHKMCRDKLSRSVISLLEEMEDKFPRVGSFNIPIGLCNFKISLNSEFTLRMPGNRIYIYSITAQADRDKFYIEPVVSNWYARYLFKKIYRLAVTQDFQKDRLDVFKKIFEKNINHTTSLL